MANGIAFEFLDVGMGDGTLIQLPPWDRGLLCLMDFGERGSPFRIAARDATYFLIRRISEVCRNRGLDGPQLDILFISHADSDHWNKLGWLITGDISESFPGETRLWETVGLWGAGTTLRIRRLVYGGSWPGDYVRRNYRLANLIRAATDSALILGNGDHDEVGAPRWNYRAGIAAEQTKIYLLSSNLPQKMSADCNPKSLVLMFEYRDLKVILTGDAEARIVEPRLLRWYPEAFLRSQVLKLGHHGSAYASSAAFLAAVRPQVVTASGDRRWGHPYCDAIERARPYLQNGNVHYFSCSASGAANDYQSTRGTGLACTNIWYVVTAPAGVTLPGPDGLNHTGPYGLYTGVQWRVQYDSDSINPYLAHTDQWPRP